MSLFIQWLPMFEVLFFNLLNVDLCSHRKYSLVQTIIGLLGFTAIFFAIFTALAQAFSFSQGEGTLCCFRLFLSGSIPAVILKKRLLSSL